MRLILFLFNFIRQMTHCVDGLTSRICAAVMTGGTACAQPRAVTVVGRIIDKYLPRAAQKHDVGCSHNEHFHVDRSAEVLKNGQRTPNSGAACSGKEDKARHFGPWR